MKRQYSASKIKPRLLRPAEFTKSNLRGKYVVVVPSNKSVGLWDIVSNEKPVDPSKYFEYCRKIFEAGKVCTWQGHFAGPEEHDPYKITDVSSLRQKCLDEMVAYFQKVSPEFLLIHSSQASLASFVSQQSDMSHHLDLPYDKCGRIIYQLDVSALLRR